MRGWVRCRKKTAGNARHAISFIVRMMKRRARFLDVRAGIVPVSRLREGSEGEHDLRDGEDEHRRPPESSRQYT